MSDQLYTGQKIRTLTIVDNFSRQSPIISIVYSFKFVDVTNKLDEAKLKEGVPKSIKVDNGSEFILKELD